MYSTSAPTSYIYLRVGGCGAMESILRKEAYITDILRSVRLALQPIDFYNSEIFCIYA